MSKGLGEIMRQAQRMQSQMSKLQEELAGRTVEGSAGGGMVTVIANGRQEIVSIRIDPAAIDPNDVEMLQDLIQAGVNDALKKSHEMASGEMSKITGGLGINIPGLF